MAAKDHCQPQIVKALQKAGWHVEKEQMMIDYSEERAPLWADLRLSKHASNQEIIIVEVKCFQDERSYLSDLYQAIGQYQVYRTALDLRGQLAPLYLAIPQPIFEGLLAEPALRATLDRATIQLIVVELTQEEVVTWYP